MPRAFIPTHWKPFQVFLCKLKKGIFLTLHGVCGFMGVTCSGRKRRGIGDRGQRFVPINETQLYSLFFVVVVLFSQ